MNAATACCRDRAERVDGCSAAPFVSLAHRRRADAGARPVSPQACVGSETGMSRVLARSRTPGVEAKGSWRRKRRALRLSAIAPGALGRPHAGAAIVAGCSSARRGSRTRAPSHLSVLSGRARRRPHRDLRPCGRTRSARRVTARSGCRRPSSSATSPTTSAPQASTRRVCRAARRARRF